MSEDDFASGKEAMPSADGRKAGEAAAWLASFNEPPEAGKAPDLSKARPLAGVYFLPEDALPPKKWKQRHPWLFRFALLCFCGGLFALGSAIYKFVSGRAALATERLGVVRIEGMILESGDTVAWIDSLRSDGSVRGVLLRINSPGGAVVPAQEIHSAVKRLAAVKPVVVSMGLAAASGGYYVAVAAPYIMASPSTITGSIGVRMDLLNMQGLADLIGIKAQTLSSGPLKEAGSPYRPLRPDEREYLQAMIQDMYEVFVEYVANGREMDPAEVRLLADGRAYTGRQALALGLVDELGDYGAALDKLAAMSGLKKVPSQEELLVGPPSGRFWLLDLLESSVLPALGLGRTGASLPGFYY
ncbi:MAG: signal peptide peptidase SppA [Deltaproteobacteria bacterium]|jgi:protease-4|nr:signal peptide peptidase SppA [Deltaproteobacteria bacterium]